MKRLFWLVFIVVSGLVIYNYLFDDRFSSDGEGGVDVVACDCQKLLHCNNREADCYAQRVSCDCDQDDNHDGVADVDDAEDVVEENPEQTAQDLETLEKSK